MKDIFQNNKQNYDLAIEISQQENTNLILSNILKNNFNNFTKYFDLYWININNFENNILQFNKYSNFNYNSDYFYESIKLIFEQEENNIYEKYLKNIQKKYKK